MAETVNPEERRAYREGIVDQKLSEHEIHFREINGQIKTLATNTGENGRKLDRVLAEMPRVLTIAEEAEKAKIVADALAQKTSEERTTWDRWRNQAAWALGVLIALVTVTNFVTRLLT